MKKICFFFTFFSITLFSIAQTPENGIFKKYYESGKINRNGEQKGVEEYYNMNGEVILRRNF